jgi:arylsulfatase
MEKWPLQRGFDNFYGILSGAPNNYFAPTGKRGLTYGNEHVEPGPNYYLTDAIGDHAIEFVKKAREKSSPFFLYVAFTSPHWPLNALKEDIDRYRGKYMNGWTALRESRLKKMKEIGLLDKSTELSDQAGPDWESLSEDKKKEMDLRMAIYAAQIDRMDQNVGRLMQTLKELNIMDNTMVIFLSDNGACAEGGMLGGGKKEDLESDRGWVLSYGEAWANASNTPFKEYKHWVHEGGISTPLIVQWPKGIPAGKNGTWLTAPGFLPDIMATFVDVSKTKYPKEYKGNKIYALAGNSMLPVLQGKQAIIHKKPIFWEHEGNCAVLDGEFKLVKKHDTGKWELYNLQTDRAEKTDLAGSMPQRVQNMQKLYQNWADTHFVVDWDVLMDKIKKK